MSYIGAALMIIGMVILTAAMVVYLDQQERWR
jgi:Tfp pilus assembly protein PilW